MVPGWYLHVLWIRRYIKGNQITEEREEEATGSRIKQNYGDNNTGHKWGPSATSWSQILEVRGSKSSVEVENKSTCGSGREKE